jgi:AcrR family transcriptional regulator
MTLLRAAGLADATEPREGEFAKSARTRRRILDAAVECLASQGYRALAVAQVAQAAGLSRATMVYHFPTRRELVVALITHVTRLRVELYETQIAGIPHDADFRERAIDLAWDHAHRPEFAAFAELAQAARTDADLASMFRPAMAAFDAARREAALRIFPADISAREDFDLSRDVLRFLLEGLVQQGGVVHDRERRINALRHFLRLLVSSREGRSLLERSVAEAAKDQP